MIDLIKLGNDRSNHYDDSKIGSKVFFMINDIKYDKETEKEVGLIKRLNNKDDSHIGFKNVCKDIIDHMNVKSLFYNEFMRYCRSGILKSIYIYKPRSTTYPIVQYHIDDDDNTIVSRIAMSPEELMLEFFMDICFMLDSSLHISLDQCITHEQEVNEKSSILSCGKVEGYLFSNTLGPCNVYSCPINYTGDDRDIVNINDIIESSNVDILVRELLNKYNFNKITLSK